MYNTLPSSSLGHLWSTMEGTLHGCVHAINLQRPLVSEHIRYYIHALPTANPNISYQNMITELRHPHSVYTYSTYGMRSYPV